jgi:hypothetical protein
VSTPPRATDDKPGSNPWWWWGVAALALGGIVLAMWSGPSSSDVATGAVVLSAPGQTGSAPPRGRGAFSADGPTDMPGLPPGSSDAGAPELPPLFDAGGPLSKNVKIRFQVYPPRRATLRWGSKSLGVFPARGDLVIERPRDSGPLDVVVRSPGFVTVHTRAYTFDHSTVDVRLTPNDQKEKLYGYRQPLPPADAGAPLEMP